MKRALIFHGTHGSPAGNWFPWLQEELMMQGWQVAAPKLPTPDGQSIDGWIEALKDQIPGYAEADVLVGHSCGGTFALRLLEKNLVEPDQTILVSCLIDQIKNEEYDSLNSSFIDHPFDWSVIKNACEDITIFHGDDDPYVSKSQAETISEKLDAPLHFIKDGGHLNADTGYTSFPALLDSIHD